MYWRLHVNKDIESFNFFHYWFFIRAIKKCGNLFIWPGILFRINNLFWFLSIIVLIHSSSLNFTKKFEITIYCYAIKKCTSDENLHLNFFFLSWKILASWFVLIFCTMRLLHIYTFIIFLFYRISCIAHRLWITGSSILC